MLYFFLGSNREKVREAVSVMLQKEEKRRARVVRVTDAHSVADLGASMQGSGLFSEKRAVVFDGIIGGENEELRARLLGALPTLKESSETFYIIEEALDVATRKMIEKYAEEIKRFDSPSKKKKSTIFVLGSALRSRNKKALWIGYHRELSKGAAPEAIHGVLFWAAKEFLLSAHTPSDRTRGGRLVAKLAELPHEARRNGFDLEYALENFTLSEM